MSRGLGVILERLEPSQIRLERGPEKLRFQLCSCHLRLPGVASLRELLDHLFVERRNVVGLAAGNEAVINNHFLIDPISTRIAHVDLDRGP